MSEAVLLHDVEDLFERIRPHLAGREPHLVGAVLAWAAATWLAGHQSDGGEATNDRLRTDLLRIHTEAIRKLIPIAEAEARAYRPTKDA